MECGLDGYHRYLDVITPFADDYDKTHDLVLSPLEIDKPIIMENIFFAFDSDEILKRSEPSLFNTYWTLVDNPEIKVEIAGHTSNEGTTKYNQKLSEKRAKAVVAFLMKNGIDPERLKARGYGESKPLNDNSTEEKEKPTAGWNSHRSNDVIQTCSGPLITRASLKTESQREREAIESSCIRISQIPPMILAGVVRKPS